MKLIKIRQSDGKYISIEIEFKAKPERLFVWKEECKRAAV